MGGLGPGIGGGEYLIIAIVALLVVGPERLPLLLRKLGKLVGKARGMANEFRSSFDEMARQSELDELRKEVEALRTGQGMTPLGAEADAAFRDIRDDLNRPLYETPSAPAPTFGGPDDAPQMEPLAPEPGPEPAPDPGAPAATPKAPRRKPAAARKASEAKAKAAARTSPTTRGKAVDL